MQYRRSLHTILAREHFHRVQRNSFSISYIPLPGGRVISPCSGRPRHRQSGRWETRQFSTKLDLRWSSFQFQLCRTLHPPHTLFHSLAPGEHLKRRKNDVMYSNGIYTDSHTSVMLGARVHQQPMKLRGNSIPIPSP